MASQFMNMFAQAPAINRIAVRAFAPKGTRLTVEANDMPQALAQLRTICKAHGLPIRATLRTARRISPSTTIGYGWEKPKRLGLKH